MKKKTIIFTLACLCAFTLTGCKLIIPTAANLINNMQEMEPIYVAEYEIIEEVTYGTGDETYSYTTINRSKNEDILSHDFMTTQFDYMGTSSEYTTEYWYDFVNMKGYSRTADETDWIVSDVLERNVYHGPLFDFKYVSSNLFDNLHLRFPLFPGRDIRVTGTLPYESWYDILSCPGFVPSYDSFYDMEDTKATLYFDFFTKRIKRMEFYAEADDINPDDDVKSLKLTVKLPRIHDPLGLEIPDEVIENAVPEDESWDDDWYTSNNEEDYSDQVETLKVYKKVYTYMGNTDYVFLLHMKNNAPVPVYVKVTGSFRNASGIEVDQDTSWSDCVESGQEFIIPFYMLEQEEDLTGEYTFQAEHYNTLAPAYQDMSCTKEQISDTEMLISTTNTGDKTIDSGTVYILFLMDGELVDYSTTGIYDLEPGQTETHTISWIPEHDDVLLIYSGNHYDY